ncbi:uncharacterized protein TRIADDRAFT_52495 [Trichoplax adhaerens]|uniref:protein-tyrosine-phosphatase n=1 Tax=Trichoplax adhaerens TaxID=10228 RepID=B3RIR1_TRIAD|nr:hypothetical protein TRIADDRAFT_52495 [Trichoplax adhaerens]EDV29025.1 hypothetical protein TRIADDRAFT_52495 [Trichoplax adhaerens]|eukprot:XP_002108227.1 hypothetical protein TRIADDRAFT_52495 [Trichoplax adhaerens]
MDLEYQQLNDTNGWVELYKSIVQSSDNIKHKCVQAKVPSNVKKNRYNNVLPYDETRVKLKGENDYINASFVSGPLDHTAASFWQMVWEQNSRGIVMLNKLTENGSIKCYQYWPLHKNQPLRFRNHFQVTLTEEIYESDDCIIRQLNLVNEKDSESRTIFQYHFTSWPDFGVPRSPASFYEFVDRIRNSESHSTEYGPLISHCSAGIGRSGTYCLVNLCLLQIQENEDLSVQPKEILIDMRKCRKGLVQTQEQLRFAYEVTLYGAFKILRHDKISCSINFDISNDNLKRNIKKVSTSAAPSKPKRSRSTLRTTTNDSITVYNSNTSTKDQSVDLRNSSNSASESNNNSPEDTSGQSLRHRSYKEKQEKTATLVAEIKKKVVKNERRSFLLRYLYRAGVRDT